MTISEYILENDISYASCDTIEISKCFAEMAVLSSLVESYNKYETICEYTSTNPAEFNIIMESATEAIDVDYTEVKSNAKSTKEKWYKSIWAWIKKTIKAMMDSFTRIDLKKMIKMLDKLAEKKPNGVIDFHTGKAHDIGQLLNIYDDFIKIIDDERPIYTENDINRIYERVEALNSSDKETSKLTFKKVISKLKDLDDDVVPRCKKISNTVDAVSRNRKNNFNEDIVRHATAIKKTATAISKLYTTNMNAFLDVQSRIIKEYKKSNSK